MYHQVDADIVDALRAIVGSDNVLVAVEAMEPYSHDETVGLRADPEVVVEATTTDQVSKVLQLAQRILTRRWDIIPRTVAFTR